MTDPTHLAALYNAAEIILWVEDRLTSAYLGELWGHDPRFAMYVGGGHENLAAVVADARRSGRGHVFALRDRDFGPTNRPGWREANVVILALETFEIDCFLLDPPALAACALNTAKRSESEIRARLHEHAAGLLWWMACRQVIDGLREARQQDFPRHPKRSAVTTQEAATRVLLENAWVRTTAPGLRENVEPTRLCAALNAAHAEYSRHLAADTWANTFSGKEIIGELVSWIYTRNRPKGSDGLEDLAKAVAREQSKAGRAPVELIELRDALAAHPRSPILAST